MRNERVWLTFDESTQQRTNEWLSAKAAAKRKRERLRQKVGVQDTRQKRKRKSEKKERKERSSVTGEADCYILPPLRLSSLRCSSIVNERERKIQNARGWTGEARRKQKVFTEGLQRGSSERIFRGCSGRWGEGLQGCGWIDRKLCGDVRRCSGIFGKVRQSSQNIPVDGSRQARAELAPSSRCCC